MEKLLQDIKELEKEKTDLIELLEKTYDKITYITNLIKDKKRNLKIMSSDVFLPVSKGEYEKQVYTSLQKTIIIEFLESNTILETIEKFKVSRAALKTWNKEIYENAKQRSRTKN